MSGEAMQNQNGDEDKPLLREDRDGLVTLTINRPSQLNALNTAVFEELDAHAADFEKRTDGIGCVIIRGAGRSFCAGADLKDIAAGKFAPGYKARVLERLSNVPQPVIASVHGHCYTGGLELALACDFIFAMESARFADTHGKWGLVASWGSSQRLPRRVGKSKAKEMGFTSRIYSAAQAHAMGLADFCVPDAQHEQELAAFVKDILANSWHTNRSVKRMLAETDGMTLAQGLAHESYRHPGRAPDMQERVARFAKKEAKKE